MDTLRAAGARRIHAVAVHGVLCGPAIERLKNAGLESIVVTDTVHVPETKQLPNLTVLTVAPLLAEAIQRTHNGESVGALFR